jgi:hypothetical protein
MVIPEEAKKKEEAYFREQELKLIAKKRKEREARLEEEARSREAERLKSLRKEHWMCCPKCGHGMEEIDLSGILVDRCTHCEGVYFDNGELEDLLCKKENERKSAFRSLMGFITD